MRVDLAAETAGEGPPLVLTHGLGDDADTWDVLWPRLAAHHRVTRWDLRGHGCSAAPDDPAAYSAEIGVQDLLEVIGWSPAPVTLVGHSLGGFLSLAVALRHPELVGALVMISSGPGFRDPTAREEWNAYIDGVAQRMPIPHHAARLAHQSDSRVIDALPSLRCPLAQIVGERDRRFHAGARFVQRTLPASVLHVVAGAGHHPQRTHPGVVLDAIPAGEAHPRDEVGRLT